MGAAVVAATDERRRTEEGAASDETLTSPNQRAISRFRSWESRFRTEPS